MRGQNPEILCVADLVDPEIGAGAIDYFVPLPHVHYEFSARSNVWILHVGWTAVVLHAALIASARQTTEELYLLSRLAKRWKAVTDVVPRRGEADAFLVNQDRNPNTRGAQMVGLCSARPGSRLAKIRKGMEEGGKLWTGDPAMMFDKLLGKEGLDFPDAFATDPRVTEKNIGLVPEDFADFWFNKKP